MLIGNYAFLGYATDVLQKLMGRKATLEAEKTALLKYFIAESTMTAEALFSIFAEFLTDFEVPETDPRTLAFYSFFFPLAE